MERVRHVSDTELLPKSKPEAVQRLEVFTGSGRRRTWSTEQKARIVAECIQEWGFGAEDFAEHGRGSPEVKPVLRATARDNLCGGESEEDFADRIAGAIWKANGAYCEVTVYATYLESLPCETHVRGERQYKEWDRGRRSPKK